MAVDDLVPARMVNEWVYCPRLAYIQYAENEWNETADTVDGTRIHGRVDEEDDDLPSPEEVPVEGAVQARGVTLSSVADELIVRYDLIEGSENGEVRPVDYKRGTVPETPERAYLPERAQIAAQVMVLRANGYRCREGVLYFAGSKTRVPVVVDAALEQVVRDAVFGLKDAMAVGMRPEPLEDSPKCVRCAMAPICLPDEMDDLLARGPEPDEEAAPDRIRRLFPARDDALPVYVTRQGAHIRKRGEELEISAPGEDGAEEVLAKARIPNTLSLSLFGNVGITAPAVRACLENDIPIAYLSGGGWLYGILQPFSHRGALLRQAQHRAAADPERVLAIARRLVRVKIHNQKTILRRNHPDVPDHVLRLMDEAQANLGQAFTLDKIRGLEGQGAALYFENFGGLIRNQPDGLSTFDWKKRTRRPPADPVNACLSYSYALLTRLVAGALSLAGLDVTQGYLHGDRVGRPSLALDLMEEFRPVLADSTVLMAINNGEIRREHFVTVGPSCALKREGRNQLIAAWERRLDGLVTHPVFGYRLSYRQVIEVQARLFGRYLVGELPEYPPFKVR